MRSYSKRLSGRDWPYRRINRYQSFTLAALFLSAATLVLGCGRAAQGVSADQRAGDLNSQNKQLTETKATAIPPLTVPAGTVLDARMLETISSRTASSGQGFDAELASPVVVGGVPAFPRGSRIRGHVAYVAHSGRLHNPGRLRLTLNEIQTPDGRWVPIQTTSVSAKGKSHSRRNWTLIGGGSGLGALIGGVAGGGSGAVIGAASGAGAGTAGAYSTGEKDVAFSAERRLRFAMSHSIILGR